MLRHFTEKEEGEGGAENKAVNEAVERRGWRDCDHRMRWEDDGEGRATESRCFPRRGKESKWRGQWEHAAHEEEDMKAGVNQ